MGPFTPLETRTRVSPWPAGNESNFAHISNVKSSTSSPLCAPSLMDSIWAGLLSSFMPVPPPTLPHWLGAWAPHFLPAGHWLSSRHSTQAGLLASPLQYFPGAPGQPTPGASGGLLGTPKSQRSSVQTLPSTGLSVLSSKEV